MRVSEIYASVQGEGPRTGQTTVFLRFGGCNLRCPGWPCDTPHAIDPAYRNEWYRIEPGDIAERVDTIAGMSGAKLVTYTGGEPFLQPKDDLMRLSHSLQATGYKLEAFTNGTLLYPPWAVHNIRMIMDWKLPGSGEVQFGPKNPTRIENVERLWNFGGTHPLQDKHAVKFVIKDEFDFTTALELYDKYLREATERGWIYTYYGKVWEGGASDADLAEAVMLHKLPWRLNVQLHNYIWDPQERGR